jgi:hypothetical protein
VRFGHDAATFLDVLSICQDWKHLSWTFFPWRVRQAP